MKTLGIDLSTQSCTLCLLDSPTGENQSFSINYSKVPRIKKSLMDAKSFIIPSPEGKAEQDPQVFLDALEICLTQTAKEKKLADVACIYVSAQQHGHVYLNESFSKAVKTLSSSLAQSLEHTYAYPYSPIWRSSDTGPQAKALRDAAGGKDFMINLTGSDSPLRFTGAVIKKFADHQASIYQNSDKILLLNTWLSCILTGNAKVPCDFANGSGMSLMDYSTKTWIPVLLNTIGTELSHKLGDISSPQTKAGNISYYFQEKYGFSSSCIVGIGTGDNPATKVLSDGDILSLGTSFVYMKNTSLDTRDYSGVANAMFDGLGRPFTIFCRTNGALVWDKVRSFYQADYQKSGEVLKASSSLYPLLLWQPENESVPISPSFSIKRFQDASLANDYKGIILSTLCLLQAYTKNFGQPLNLAVTGGPSYDVEILSIIADIWECPVTILPSGGAALGAALSAYALADSSADLPELRKKLSSSKMVEPQNEPALNNYKKELLDTFKEVIHNYA